MTASLKYTSLLLLVITTLCVAFCPKQPQQQQKRRLTKLFGGYNSDPIMGSYWNRENSIPKDFSGKIIKQARIICLSDPEDANNNALYKGDDELPAEAKVLAVGSTIEQFDIEMLKAANPNVIFVSHPNSREPLAKLLELFPSVEWVHARSAGIDFITSPQLLSQARGVTLTNAKGCFSSTLAEYTLMACSYFAKDLPRLLKTRMQKIGIDTMF
mmetsp:Transcript_30583/g.45579  ORF Transcript_30583/g.45579 Transcript_30583/m.45579 type:complete len:214 (-) Transcript_30583:601-1242(-)